MNGITNDRHLFPGSSDSLRVLRNCHVYIVFSFLFHEIFAVVVWELVVGTYMGIRGHDIWSSLQVLDYSVPLYSVPCTSVKILVVS